MLNELAPPLHWRAVAAADFQPDSEATWCRGHGWLAWQLAGEHVGIRCERAPDRLDEATLLATVGASVARFERCDVMLDTASTRLADWRAELSATEQVMLQLTRELGQRVRRSVVVATTLSPWWRGVLASAEPAFPWQVVASRDDAWRWLATPHTQAVVERLINGDQARPTLLSLLESLLQASPGADLCSVARSLGFSGRSLQRALAEQATSFNAVRDDVRLAIAHHHLADASKIGAIADAVGFASPAHFCLWFRRHTGLTPSAHRRIQQHRDMSPRVT